MAEGKAIRANVCKGETGSVPAGYVPAGYRRDLASANGRDARCPSVRRPLTGTTGILPVGRRLVFRHRRDLASANGRDARCPSVRRPVIGTTEIMGTGPT